MCMLSFFFFLSVVSNGEEEGGPTDEHGAVSWEKEVNMGLKIVL